MDEFGIGELEQCVVADGICPSRAARQSRRLPGRGAGGRAGSGDVDRPKERRRLRAGAAHTRVRHRVVAHGTPRLAAFALMSAVLDAPVEHHDALVVRFDNGAIGTCPAAPSISEREATVTRWSSGRSAPRDSSPSTSSATSCGSDRADGVEFRPALEPAALLYNCDGPPNTLVDLALGQATSRTARPATGRPRGRDSRRRLSQCTQWATRRGRAMRGPSRIPLRCMGAPEQAAARGCSPASTETTFSAGVCFDVSRGWAP